MYFVKIDDLLFPRFPGPEGKTAGSPGMLTLKNIKRYKQGWGIGDGSAPQSQNPLLRGMPPTSSRQAPPLVVTMGTTGV